MKGRMIFVRSQLCHKLYSMSQSRQLAAIMFTDIVGYTSIMQRDEAEAVTIIKRYITVLRQTVITHSIPTSVLCFIK
jgi:class 3 adenylate cyclase